MNYYALLAINILFIFIMVAREKVQKAHKETAKTLKELLRLLRTTAKYKPQYRETIAYDRLAVVVKGAKKRLKHLHLRNIMWSWKSEFTAQSYNAWLTTLHDENNKYLKEIYEKLIAILQVYFRAKHPFVSKILTEKYMRHIIELWLMDIK